MKLYGKVRKESTDEEHRPDGPEFVVLRTINEIEEIRPIWERMQKEESSLAVSDQIDTYLSTLEANAETARPYVILAKQNDRPIAIAMGRVGEHPIAVKLGYKVLLSPRLRCLSVVYRGILSLPGEYGSTSLIAELIKMLRRREFDVICFHHVRIDSPIYKAARKLPGVLNRGHFPRIETHWSLTLPGDIELFYQARSKKHRANLKRYIRKLETEYPNKVQVVTYTREDHLDEAIRAAAEISRLTYQHGLACGVVDDSRTHILLRNAARQGRLRMSLLFIDGQACAFQVGLCCGKAYGLAQIGFDPKWSRFEVGTVLFLKVLEDLCVDPDIESVSFGFGDSDYKRSYANNHWREASVYIFALRPYPIALNMLQSASTAFSLGLKYFADKIGVGRWLKRRWRTALQGGIRAVNDNAEFKKPPASTSDV